MNTPAEPAALWPLAAHFFAVVLLVASMLLGSYLLGQRSRGRTRGEPYESGIAATGTARIRFDIKFYLVAMLFVVFDIEAVFIFAWAVSIYELGWAGYIEVLVFISVLLAALLYLWRMGALDFGSSKKIKKIRTDALAKQEGTDAVVP